MKISDQAMRIVGTWSAAQDRPLEIRLTAADHPHTEQLREFCQWLAGECAQLTISETVTPGKDLPALHLRQGAIVYRSVPMGTELEPFLEALASDDGTAPGDFRPAALQIFVAAGCPHCPGAVRALLPLALADGPVSLEVIDSETCSELAEADNVKSVPTLILDQTFRWTGTIRHGDIEELLSPGIRSGISAGALERLLESGNAGPVADLMLQDGQANPGLCQLMANEAMSVRLGAMMVVEDLLERSPELVERLVPELWQQLPQASEPAQGDMLYIIGEAGPPNMVAGINRFLETDPHPEVAEAAREALERLAERYP